MSVNKVECALVGQFTGLYQELPIQFKGVTNQILSIIVNIASFLAGPRKPMHMCPFPRSFRTLEP